MKNIPRVSIVIPAYNEEKIIRATVEFALAQDYPNFEVIVANNASTDDTAQILDSIKDPHLKVVFESRKGTSFAREAGRLAATGSIIGLLDADCAPNKDWISKGVQFFNNPDVVAVTGPYNYHDSSDFFRYSTLYSQYALMPTINFITRYMKQGGVLIGGNAFIRADVLAKAGGYDTNLTF